MFDSGQMARKAYFAMLDDLAQLQCRVVMRKLLRAEFPDTALPQESILRGMIGALAKAGRRADEDRAEERDRKRIAELTETLHGMEAVFQEQSDADIQAFADYIRGKYGKAKPK